MPDIHSNIDSGKLNLDIPVFQKTYDLYKSFYLIILDFPKKDRYTIGQRVENTILSLLERYNYRQPIIQIGKSANFTKSEY